MPSDKRVHRTAQLRDPHRDAVMLEQRRHHAELASVKGPFAGTEHDRVELTLRISHRHQKGGGLRPTRRRQGPTVADVEELRHDPAVPCYQGLRLQELPRPRARRILVVLGGHPPVEGEPQTT
ncbi:hypothetical protein E6W39_34575 [Kitasatospora acidiphila]|uniref:Uncharacterized protein n=1 Tax=Kitasatospora acidiphila TaxID=2567942 RepID=A0A540WBS9_9ACTN|nr:hypothetical protein E6W39_34575 [Kitasatospora acidiphila]